MGLKREWSGPARRLQASRCPPNLAFLSPPRQCLQHSAIMGEQLKFRGQLVAHEDWVTSIAATSEVRR